VRRRLGHTPRHAIAADGALGGTLRTVTLRITAREYQERPYFGGLPLHLLYELLLCSWIHSSAAPQNNHGRWYTLSLTALSAAGFPAFRNTGFGAVLLGFPMVRRRIRMRFARLHQGGNRSCSPRRSRSAQAPASDTSRFTPSYRWRDLVTGHLARSAVKVWLSQSPVRMSSSVDGRHKRQCRQRRLDARRRRIG